MKKNLPLSFLALLILFFFFCACSRKNYASSYFDQQTTTHKIIAVVPAEIIFTGKQPKNISQQQIDSIEEEESKSFQLSLQNSILQHANSRRYYMRVNIQDISTTLSLMEKIIYPSATPGARMQKSWQKF
ncbi:MAG: hypothetical protein HYX40_08595 [Sphingobacteriales bacterium]|nr:hypothetical protein [Sphingobacteriales bacterium]